MGSRRVRADVIGCVCVYVCARVCVSVCVHVSVFVCVVGMGRIKSHGSWEGCSLEVCVCVCVWVGVCVWGGVWVWVCVCVWDGQNKEPWQLGRVLLGRQRQLEGGYLSLKNPGIRN